MTTRFGIGMPGPLELAIILGILLLLFGSRLPSLMRNLGKGVTEFKKGVHGSPEDEDFSDEARPTSQRSARDEA